MSCALVGKHMLHFTEIATSSIRFWGQKGKRVFHSAADLEVSCPCEQAREGLKMSKSIQPLNWPKPAQGEREEEERKRDDTKASTKTYKEGFSMCSKFLQEASPSRTFLFETSVCYPVFRQSLTASIGPFHASGPNAPMSCGCRGFMPTIKQLARPAGSRQNNLHIRTPPLRNAQANTVRKCPNPPPPEYAWNRYHLSNWRF